MHLRRGDYAIGLMRRKGEDLRNLMRQLPLRRFKAGASLSPNRISYRTHPRSSKKKAVGNLNPRHHSKHSEREIEADEKAFRPLNPETGGGQSQTATPGR